LNLSDFDWNHLVLDETVVSLDNFFTMLNLENCGIDKHRTNEIRITVGRRSSVFEVTLLVHDGLGGDSGRRSSISNTVTELVNRSSFVTASQSQVVVRTIDSDVGSVSLGEEFHGLEDSVITTILSGGFEREVGVASRTVPVTLDRLGFESDIDVVFFADSGQQISGNPELITTFETFDGANLEFPLTREDFGIKARDLDTSSQTASHMGFSDVSTDSVGRADWTVVLALRMSKTSSGETDRPSVGSTFVLKENVFLFETEPGFLINSFLEDLSGIISEVSLSRGLEVRVVGFAKNQISFFLSVGTFVVSERIRAEINGLEDNFRALGGSLTSGRTIVVPDGEVFNLVADLGDTHSLGSQIEAGTADPDVFSDSSFHGVCCQGSRRQRAHQFRSWNRQ
jgi:hypothetical protein